MRDASQSWEEAKRQAVAVLSRKAVEQDTIAYNRFVRRIKAIPDLKYHGDLRLDQLLDEVSLEEDKAGRGFISVLVVEATSPYMPSHGFFALASPRHPPGTDRKMIFETERDIVYRAHTKPESRAKGAGTGPGVSAAPSRDHDAPLERP